VILNKDNAEGLRRALESLYSQSCRPCECFDIYIVDGGSSDGSLSVAYEASSKIPCIYWVEQRVKGGTGPARIEVVEILRARGYRYILWGDSENTYARDYVERIVSMLRGGCDIASGRSVVVRRSVWAEAFYWYHSFHNIFPRLVGSKHAPGNNMGARAEVYSYASYPPSKRSDDYIFTLQLMKAARARGAAPRYCVDEGAVVYVAMASSFPEVVSWQRSRVVGLVHGSIYAGFPVPPDLLSWSAPLALLIAFIALSIAYLEPVLLAPPLLAMVGLALFLHVKSRAHLDSPTPFSGLLGLAGMILHAVFTTAYSLWEVARVYILVGRSALVEHMRRAEEDAKRSSPEDAVPLAPGPRDPQDL